MLTRAKRRRQDEEEEAKYPPHERERKARIARAKAELMTLTVKELKKELKLFANPKVYTGQYSAMGESSPRLDWSYDRAPYWHYFPPKYPVPQKGDMADWLANQSRPLEHQPRQCAVQPHIPGHFVQELSKVVNNKSVQQQIISKTL